MKNGVKKTLSVCTIASVLITSSAIGAKVKAAVTPPESPRLWGSDRYETALKVSQAGWTSGSDYAVIASGEGYADALCAAPLAKVNNAPILLTQKDSLSQNTLEELKRLNVKHVYIIGGQAVVSQAVEDQIKSQITSDIQRLSGQNRYETSVKVAEKLGTVSKVVLASGEGYADALSAAPVAAIEGMPILLTPSSTLAQPTVHYIKANTGITKTYVIGGTASVSDAAASAAPGAQRFSGVDRYATNAAVINGFAADFDFSNAYVALGNGPAGNEFADALAGSALAAKNKNPLIITGKTLSSDTENIIKNKLTTTSTITVLGGTANLSDDLIGTIKSYAGKGEIILGGGGGGGAIIKVIKVDAPLNQGDPAQEIEIPTNVTTVKLQITVGGTPVTLAIPQELAKSLNGKILISTKAVTVPVGSDPTTFSALDLEITDAEGNKITTPIAITLPIPSGVTSSNAAGLHYDEVIGVWTNRDITSSSSKDITFKTTFSPVAVAKVDKIAGAPTVADPVGTPNQIEINWANIEWNTTDIDTYNVYRNGELIGSKLKTTEFNDYGFAKGENKYYVVACNTNGIPIKKTDFTKKYVTKSALSSWIEKAISIANDYGIITNNIDIDSSNGDVTVSVLDESLKTKSISEIFAEKSQSLLDKVKNKPYDQTKITALKSYIDPIDINGKSVKEAIISKLQGRAHTQTAINFINNPNEETYNALKDKLNDQAEGYDTYNEVVDAIKNAVNTTVSRKIPAVAVSGTILEKVIIHNITNKTDHEFIVGRSYSEDDVKTALGVTKAVGDITLSDIGNNTVIFKFSNGEKITVKNGTN